MRKFRLNCGVVIGLYLMASIAWADSLELKNGSLIKAKFMGGTESEISFQVGSSVQKYNVADAHEPRTPYQGELRCRTLPPAQFRSPSRL